jgi:hypothetical protein
LQVAGTTGGRLSSSSLDALPLHRHQLHRHQQQEQAQPGGGGLTALLASAAATVAEQLSAGRNLGPPPLPRKQQQPKQQPEMQAPQQQGLGGGAAFALGKVPPAAPPQWQLRCAVLSSQATHIDVTAGWAHAFQVGGNPGSRTVCKLLGYVLRWQISH